MRCVKMDAEKYRSKQIKLVQNGDVIWTKMEGLCIKTERGFFNLTDGGERHLGTYTTQEVTDVVAEVRYHLIEAEGSC